MRRVMYRQRGAVDAALQEDVDVIGLSILSGPHIALVPRIFELMKANDLNDVKVVIDPTVLGGLVTTIGDTVIDGSVRTRLDQLKQRI